MSWSDDFLQGQKDCRDGKPHKDGNGDGYDRGYNTQYIAEQIWEAGTRGHRKAKRTA